MARCDELAAISSDPQHLVRTHLTAEHRAAHDLVDGWMREAGMSTWMDAAGNRYGRIEGSEPGLAALLLGSHTDTVPDAGRYDGMLGVLLAIAVAARIRAGVLPFALEVVAFSDEEGTRFGTPLLGSRALSGTWDDDWWQAADADGVILAEAFTDFGLDPARLPEAIRAPEELIGYIEAHIEQGPHLQDADRRLGMVTSIAGARRFTLAFTGRAGHAGGTPLDRRRDALVGASEFVLAVETASKIHGTIGTVGRLQAFPGGVNVIPGRVDLSLDLRAEHDDARDATWAELQRVADDICRRRGLGFESREASRADAVACDENLTDAIASGIRSTGDSRPLRLWSRAGHDGMAVAAVTPIAMLFIRCLDGVSHHPDESVRTEDVAAALDAFGSAVHTIAGLAVARRTSA